MWENIATVKKHIICLLHFTSILMKTKNILITFAVIIVIASGFYFFTNSSTPTVSPTTTKTINFGAVLALSGYAVTEGTQIKNGTELAKAELAKEGITMNVEYYDDTTDPKKSVAGVEYMHSKGITTIFGPTWSYQITAALPKIAEYNMMAFIGDTSSDVVEGDASQKSLLVHGISPTYQIEAPTAEWIKQQGIKKIAILTVDGTWGNVYTAAWKKAAEDAGAEVVLVDMFDYPSEPTTLPTLIIKAKSLHVDGIVWTGTEAGAIAMVKKMQELKYNVPVLGTVYIKQASDTGKITKGDSKLYEIENMSSQAFRDNYKKIYGTEPGAVAEPAYDLAMIAAHTELEKGAMTTQEYLLSKEHKGYASTYKFDKNGDVINHGWKIIKI